MLRPSSTVFPSSQFKQRFDLYNCWNQNEWNAKKERKQNWPFSIVFFFLFCLVMGSTYGSVCVCVCVWPVFIIWWWGRAVKSEGCGSWNVVYYRPHVALVQRAQPDAPHHDNTPHRFSISFTQIGVCVCSLKHQSRVCRFFCSYFFFHRSFVICSVNRNLVIEYLDAYYSLESWWNSAFDISCSPRSLLFLCRVRPRIDSVRIKKEKQTSRSSILPRDVWNFNFIVCVVTICCCLLFTSSQFMTLIK